MDNESRIVNILDKDEAICYVDNPSNEARRFITKQLSFFYPGYQFMPSYRAGISDGKKKFFKFFGDKLIFPKGLVHKLVRTLEKEKFTVNYTKIEYNDYIPSMEEFTEFVKTLNIPFEPYDYQILSAYESLCNYRQINLMATGSGKSLTIYLLIRWFLEQEFKSVIIVPTVMLVSQLFSDFVGYLGIEDIENEISYYKNKLSECTCE